MAEQSVYAFVVLQYRSFSFTEACVDSVLALADEKRRVKVVVVDNGSPDDSGQRAEERFAASPDVDVLRLSENVGFSVGNNAGYEHAVKAWGPRAVLVINNDTEIRQPDFLERLDRDLAEETYYVIGPDIYVERKGLHQSPTKDHAPTRQELQKQADTIDAPGYDRTIRRIALKEGRGPLSAAYRVYLGVRYPTSASSDGSPLWEQRSVDSMLHGAALIFTDRFIATGQLPFEPVVFLYLEEEILARRCQMNGWPVLYDPELQVIHYDDGSTDQSYRSALAKIRFIVENRRKSLDVALGLYD